MMNGKREKNIEFIRRQLYRPLRNNPKHIPDMNCEISEKCGSVQHLLGSSACGSSGCVALVCNCSGVGGGEKRVR